MKILHIITKSEVGGAQTWVKNLAELYPEHSHLLLTSENGWLCEQSCFDNRFLIKEINSYSMISSILKIRAVIKKTSPDIIITSSANAGLYGRLAAFLSKKKVVYISHGWSCLYNGGYFRVLFTFIEKLMSKLTGNVICVSNNDYQLALNKIGISSESMVCIPNKAPKPIAKNTIDKYGIDKNKLNFLFLARLAYPKRADLLIDCIKQSNLDNVVYHIVGDGPQYESLKKYACENIIFHGAISGFSDFELFDGLILLSDSEGLPMSVLEAGAAGIPLFLSNVGGCPELITSNGVLTENDITDVSKNLDLFIGELNKYNESARKLSDFYKMESCKEKYDEFLLNEV
ncbi:glycosyltransferase [Vibrio vulnificus]|uniref:glycosyltransferase n=1 Tax=Vibrio vulnificus TaxID=672 RepID=UPI0009B63442|nr:glycosyltransferase [Vibrio vulnificus]EHV5552245.1 glycosyltransferase [Vibrio vulnificus]ELP5903113.1 glycosyltransferase [Vibrio vulnificus]MCU8465654.1 glycosyltransferase [Vibrio vulnificus]OQK43041.1 glycosyl transferase, group 1 family [Vibrio vulnificus]HAS8569989.1 glycosyltransferase [Vibrio vulnificus]